MERSETEALTFPCQLAVVWLFAGYYLLHQLVVAAVAHRLDNVMHLQTNITVVKNIHRTLLQIYLKRIYTRGENCGFKGIYYDRYVTLHIGTVQLNLIDIAIDSIYFMVMWTADWTGLVPENWCCLFALGLWTELKRPCGIKQWGHHSISFRRF